MRQNPIAAYFPVFDPLGAFSLTGCFFRRKRTANANIITDGDDDDVVNDDYDVLIEDDQMSKWRVSLCFKFFHSMVIQFIYLLVQIKL